MRNKLHGRKPDYHFYRAGDNIPIAFLEAKSPGSDLEKALRQAREYVKDACAGLKTSMLVFASDGFQVRSQHADGSELFVNGYPVDYIPSCEIMTELVKNPSVDLGERIDSVAKLLEIFKKAANLMRRDGIDPGLEQLREFCIILFIKIMSEKGSERERKAWDNFRELNGNSLKQAYMNLLQSYSGQYGDLLSVSKMDKPKVIEEIIKSISKINFTISEIDVKGEAFEFFLKNYSAGQKSSLGQFFTPRHITEMMSIMLNPKLGDRILDPFCGTGGMLISCYKHIKRGLESNISNSDRTELNKKTFFGTDISHGASSLAIMNMILLGDGHSNIQKADSFEYNGKDTYDKVITNIPFNVKDIASDINNQEWVRDSGLENPDMNSLAVLRCLASLKRDGEGAIIVPLTMCVSQQYRQIRNYIANNCRLKACLRLPEKTFISYTTARTAILLFDGAHTKKTTKFIHIDIKKDGMSQDKKREFIPENEIPGILEKVVDDRLEDIEGAKIMSYKDGGSFIEFAGIISPNGGVWKLRELLDLKTKQDIVATEWYAEPRLDSQNNAVSPGKKRLGKNIRASQKIFAEPGDLIIATLHTNSNNGLFAISNGNYICESQLVGKIREDLVPSSYLVKVLRKEFPRQLIPFDLVGRETFSTDQILDVLLPKPSAKEIKQLRKLDETIHQAREAIQTAEQEINKYIQD